MHSQDRRCGRGSCEGCRSGQVPTTPRRYGGRKGPGTPEVGEPPGKKRRKSREMPQGTVEWVNAEKGFGFIAPEDWSTYVFVPYTEIQGSGSRTLEENQKVEIEVSQSHKGTQ